MEFDIRIGTLLDTSQAEAQLQEFINKYSGDNNFKINLKISGDEKLEGIAKSLNNIKNLAKSISNIRIDFDGENLSVDTNVKETIRKAKEQMKDATEGIANEMGRGVEQSVKNVAKSLDKQIEDTKKRIESMVKNLEDLKLNPFADSDTIDKMMASLKEMGTVSFDNFPNLTLQALNEEMEEFSKTYDELVANAKSKQLDDIFQTTKIEPLRQQILSLKEVMDFKDLDTSSLDKLLDNLKNTIGMDLKQAKTVFADVKSAFSNIEKTTDIKGVKSYETAIKKLLEYKEKLQDQIRMEIDTSKIQKAEADIKRIDDAIDRLKANADESIVKNLFDMSELKNMENMEKSSKTLKGNMDKLGNVFDKLKAKFTQLSQGEFVDIASIAAIESLIRDIENNIKSLDFDNLKGTDIKNVTEDMENLEACINSVEKSANRMELEVKFANDLDKVTKQLNGLHAALIKVGGDTGSIEELEKELKSIEGLAKINLGRAGNELKTFSKNLDDITKESKLGNISGDLNQFAKYVNEIESLMKKLATTKDINFANTIREEIRKIDSAMEQLKKTFDQDGINFADALRTDMLDRLSEKFGQEVNKIQQHADKLNTTLYKIGKDANFEGINGEKLAEAFREATNQVEKLQNAIQQAKNSKMDIEGIEKLQSDLREAENVLEKLSTYKIKVDCDNAIAKMERLKESSEEVREALENIDGANVLNRIISDFENGAITFDKATASIKKFDDALDRIGDSSGKVSKSFDMFDSVGTKIEGAFQSIGNAFSQFTVGELLEEGIENLAYGVVETITGLDQAMTELRRVAPEGVDFSSEGYKQIANDAREVALSVGQSTEDVIKGMSTALQAGATTMQQATEIAKTSALLQNVSDMGADEASQAIASMVNQYYDMDTALGKVQDRIQGAPADYNNLTNAIDMVNYAGNNWAISSQGVAEALQNGGSVLSNYGVTLSDSIAMISSANESLQDPSRIGNGLRSLAVNFAGIKTNAKEGTVEMNKSAKALKEIAGIDIFTDSSKTSVKDMMTLMDEVYDKWDSLTDVQQKGLSEGLAGKTQAAVFQSLMSGWDRVRQFQQEYKDGFMVGSAEQENMAYLDSIAGKWNTLKENMKALLTNNVSTDFIKGLLDAANNAVTAIDKIISKLGTFGTGTALIGIMSFIKSMSNFSSLSGLTGMAKVVSTIFTSLKGGTGVFSAISSGFTSMASGAGLATVATAGLQAVLSALGWGILIAGIALAIKAWNDYAHATENAIKASKEREQGYQTEVQGLNSQISSLNNLSNEYETLANKTNKTMEETARYREICREIAELAPELVTGYDVNGDPILALSGNLDDYIKKLQEAKQEKMELVQYEQSLQAQTYMSDDKDTREYKNELQDAIDQVNNKGKYEGANPFIVEGGAQDGLAAIEAAAKQYKSLVNQRRERNAELAELNAEYLETEKSITSQVLRNLQEESTNYGKLSEKNKSAMTTFVDSLDLGDFNTAQYLELARGLDVLADKSTSFSNYTKQQKEDITSTGEAFRNGVGSIEAYGDAVTSAFKDKGVDITTLNEYVDAVNKNFSNTGDIKQYQAQMQELAHVIADITGMDYDTIYKGLRDGFNLQALQEETRALDNFLDKNQKSIDEWAKACGDGGKKAKEALTESFEGLNDFLAQTFEMGGFDVEYLNKVADTLPKQLQHVAEAITKDGEATEIEQKFMVAVSTEIANEGEVTDGTIKQLQDLMNGVELDHVEIAGYWFEGEELEGLKATLDATGWSAEQLAQKLKDNGLDGMLKDAEALGKALDELDFSKKVNDAFKEISFDNVGGVNALKKAIGEFESEEVQIEFIAECGQFFADASNMQEAIQNIMDAGQHHLLLKYGIEVEGDEEFTRIQNIYNNLPKSIQTLVNTEVIGYDNIEKVKQFMDEGVSEKTITTLMEIPGADEALTKAKSLREFLEALSNLVSDPEVNLEAGDAEEKYNLIMQLLDELDGKETTSEHKVEADTEGAEKAEEKHEELDGKKTESEHEVKSDTEGAEKAEEKHEELDGKKTESEHKVNANTEEAEKAEETQGNLDGKNTESTHTTNTEDSQVDETIEKVDKLSTTHTGEVVMTVRGEQQLVAVVNEKNKLEVEGHSLTYVEVEGGERVQVAITEKGELEVNGIAQTHIQVVNGEELTFSKNEKGELEVNGQAVTTVTVSNQDQLNSAREEQTALRTNGESNTNMNVNGLENVEAGAEAVENLPDEKSVSVKFDVNDAIDSILSRLGLDKKTETIEITVKAIDEASSVLDKINGYEGKTVTFTITANGGSEAAQQIQTIAKTTINNKTFTIVCSGGQTVSSQIKTISSTSIANKTFSITANTGTVSSQLNSIATRTIPNKTFQITCSDTASAKISALSSRQIPSKTFTVTCNDQASSKLNAVQNKKVQNKTFTINCTDQASSKIASVQGKKINNKSFTVSCTDNASSKLSSIASKLSAIKSKSITVTTTYKQVGSPPKNSGGTGPSASQPQVMEVGNPIVMNSDSMATTMETARTTADAVNEAMASTKASFTDSIWTGAYWIDLTFWYDSMDLLKDYNEQLERVSGNLDLVSKKAEIAFGSSKANMLKEEIALMQQKQTMLNFELSKLKTIRDNSKQLVREYGFGVDENGSVYNHTTRLKELEDAVYYAEKAQKNYTGDDEARQKSLQNAYDQAKQKLDFANKALESYYETSKQVTDTEAEWYDLQKQINDVKNEIYEANKAQANFYKEARSTELEHQYDELADKLDIIQAKMETSNNTDKIGLLEQELSLLEQQRLKNLEIEESYRNQQQYYKDYLSGKGFKFDEDGDVINASTQLDKYKADAEIKSIQDAYEQYMQLQRDTIPDLEKDWYDLQSAEQKAKEEIENIQKEMEELNKTKIFDNINDFTEKQEDFSREMEKLEVKLDTTYGMNKTDVLNEQIKLLKKQMETEQNITSELKNQMKYLQSSMKNSGFNFDFNGNITNLDSVLSMAQTSEEYEELQKQAEEYLDIQNQVTDSETEWLEYQKTIKETEDEIENLKHEMIELKEEARLQELNNDLTILEGKLEKIQSLDSLNGINSLDMLNKQLDIIKEQQEATLNLIDFRKQQVKELSSNLITYGFKINDDGTIDDTAGKLEVLKNVLSEDEFSRVEDYLANYFEVALEEIPDLENQLIDYQSEYEDILKSKLETTEKIEKEITKIIEKQIEDRIEVIEKEKDAQVESLKAQKDAYNKWRDEVDYEDDYNEQLEKVQELQSQIEIAKRDDSLNGQKRVEELMNELKEEQKALEELVQNKIDEDINNMIDDQIEKIETNADKQIEDLENIFTETKIAEMVAQAIQTGIFTDIEGNVTALDQALMDFANNSIDYMGVMGESLKTELLDNLNIALETMAQLNEINSELNNGNYNIATLSPIINAADSTLTGLPTVQGVNSNSVTLGDMVINVQGSIDRDSLGEVEALMKQQRTQIINEIMLNIK